MASTTYQEIPEELWQQGTPERCRIARALVRWEELPDEGGATCYEYAICQYFRGSWYPVPGVKDLDFTYPDTIRYIDFTGLDTFRYIAL
jgi:hypothetical protein